MKRILSVLLCVAMLASMVSMTVSGASGQYADQVTTENVMKITTDKASYAPGETVVITASMESIWGDTSIEDALPGYEEFGPMPGAYGMAAFNATLIYDPAVFTAKAHPKTFYKSSTIANAAIAELSGSNPIEAKPNGAYNQMLVASVWNADYDGYGYLTGSGDLFQWNLTIAADATPGTYYLPIGPYVITDEVDGPSLGKHPAIKFADEGLNDRLWAWTGNADSFDYDREVIYDTGYTGESRVAADSPKGDQYECSYITVVIEGEGPVDPPVVEPDDPMALELVADSTGYVAGETVTVDLKVNNNTGIISASHDLKFNNTDLKLTEVTSAIETLGEIEVNYDSANKQGSFDSLGTLATALVNFNGNTEYAEDGVIATFKFEVLSTAEGGDSAVTVSMYENGLEASVNVALAGDHTHSFTEKTIPAECRKAGSIDQVCSCGLTYKISTIPALQCVPSTTNVATVPATCTIPGYTNYYCEVCGLLAKTDETEALGHDLKVVKTQLTCTTDETETEVCQREGCKYTSETVVINTALGHKNPDGTEAWGDPYVATKPTTNSVGYWGKDCAICGDVYRYQEIEILAVVYGNCDMDEANKINIDDVIVLLKYIAKWSNLYFSPENADVNLDGRYNAMDVTRILKYIAGWDVVLGEEADKIG